MSYLWNGPELEPEEAGPWKGRSQEDEKEADHKNINKYIKTKDPMPFFTCAVKQLLLFLPYFIFCCCLAWQPQPLRISIHPFIVAILFVCLPGLVVVCVCLKFKSANKHFFKGFLQRNYSLSASTSQKTFSHQCSQPLNGLPQATVNICHICGSIAKSGKMFLKTVIFSPMWKFLRAPQSAHIFHFEFISSNYNKWKKVNQVI